MAKYRIHIRNVDQEAWTEIEKLEKRLEEIRGAVLKKFRESEKCRVAQEIASASRGGAVATVKVVGGTLELDFAEYTGNVVRGINSSQRYMDTATLNLLLNGKLLTADEKRAMLFLRHPELVEAAEGRVRVLRLVAEVRLVETGELLHVATTAAECEAWCEENLEDGDGFIVEEVWR